MVLPQLGYDMRKFHEIKLMLASRGISGVPLLGNVYLLTKGVAKLFNSGKLAGCVVSDELLATIEKYAAGADKGRKFCQELAAKQLAVFKGLGFAAGYLGGMAKAETFGQIIDLAESYGPNDGGIHQGNPLLAARRVLPVRAQSRDGLERPHADQSGPQGIASPSAKAEGRDLGLSLLAAGAPLVLYPRQGLLRPGDVVFRRWDKKPGWTSRMAWRPRRFPSG